MGKTSAIRFCLFEASDYADSSKSCAAILSMTLITCRLQMRRSLRVGIVGEILVKFLPAANNHLVDLLESEGAEAVDAGSDGLSCSTASTTRTSRQKILARKIVPQPLETAGIALLEYFRSTGCQRHLQQANILIRLHISRIWLSYGKTDRLQRKSDR